jgi:hypothetical protein
MQEESKIRYKYLFTDDKILFCIGIFVILCIICIILLFTIPTNNISNNKIIDLNYNSTYKNNTQISVTYNIFNSSIYFKSNGNIKFKENTRANVLIVGGGGGASYGGGWITGGSGTGGGGGGGVGEGILLFKANTVYNIIVGNGGKAVHNKVSEKGGYSEITGIDINERAEGGGFGGYYSYNSAGGGSYGFTGEVIFDGEVYQYNNTYYGKSVGGKGKLTYHSYSGGRGEINNIINAGSGGGGAGGAGNAPIDNIGGIGGDCYLWKLNNQCYGRGGNGGSITGLNVSTPSPNNGDGGSGASTRAGHYSTSGSSGIVIIN